MRQTRTRQRGLRRNRNRILASADLAAWAVGLTVATVGRFDFSWGPVDEVGVLSAVVVAALAQVAVGTACGLYRGRWTVASFEELSVLGASVAVTAAVLTAAVLVLPGPQLVPRSVPTLAAALALVGMLAARWLWRSAEQRRRRPSGDGVDPVVVLGAGESGQQVIRAMLRDPASPWLPVALLDDDPASRRLTIMGVPVLGGRADLPAVARARGARAVVIAVPSAGGELVREVAALAASAALEVRVVPPVSELLGPVGVADIRQLTDADLLGRHEISTDVAAIAGSTPGNAPASRVLRGCLPPPGPSRSSWPSCMAVAITVGSRYGVRDSSDTAIVARSTLVSTASGRNPRRSATRSAHRTLSGSPSARAASMSGSSSRAVPTSGACASSAW